jgi:hypothetical protein
MKEKITYIPAQPGFHVVELDYDDGGNCRPSLTPVIAWELAHEPISNRISATELYLAVHPVTPVGPNHDATVVYPDGKVSTPLAGTFDNVTAWMKCLLTAKTSGSTELPKEA